ncbi:MAG: hypothetical protein ACI8ZO_001742 [Flavobacteriales bacterium]|jgi:hypothetical protein
MQKTITQNDLLLYLYNEAPLDLQLEIEDHLIWDVEIKDELLQLMKIKDGLNCLEAKPSLKSLSVIKSFSSAYRVVQCKDFPVGFILN